MDQPDSLIDPGRLLRHALVYVSKYASLYAAEAWVEAQNILYRAHNEFEDDDRIEFVRNMERHERSDVREELVGFESLIELECGTSEALAA